jgi:AbrB family looped-hinge helix DNA binding protein
MRNMISTNLQTLRKRNKLTQEEVAEKINVSRQAVAKWENGETTPDINNCVALANLYNVKVDDLINYSDDSDGAYIPPKGKHIFGTVTMGERGQIVIPKKARDIFHLKPGDDLIVLGDEEQGLAIMKEEGFMKAFSTIMKMIKKADE